MMLGKILDRIGELVKDGIVPNVFVFINRVFERELSGGGGGAQICCYCVMVAFRDRGFHLLVDQEKQI